MSIFYGTVQGQRGPATRCGSLSSGISAAAQSWHGSVTVSLNYERGIQDHEHLMVGVRSRSSSAPGGLENWYGSFDEFVQLLELGMSSKNLLRRA